MIRYKSTRGDNKLYTFSQAILKGIAEDGGLLVPEKIPHLTLNQLTKLTKKSYQERACFILNLFQTGLAKSLIKSIVNQAYSVNFDTPDIAPLVHLKDNQYLLELWHGPTSAFKDLALQVMPLLFLEAVKASRENCKYLILTATSGDTGAAALAGYNNKDNLSIIVFYPHHHVSKLQELQMTTADGKNIAVFSLKGDFDKVQTTVKAVFNDQQFNQTLRDKYQIVLSSANSINWGRLLPQIIYHITSYMDLADKGIIELGDPVDMAVPTGNFGNIMAAFYAKKMGLPVAKLICASNINSAVAEFLQTGVYDVSGRQLIKTPSPSMDILMASNIERLLYTVTNSAEKVCEWMRQLKFQGKFEVDSVTKTILQKGFYAGAVSNQDSLTNIGKIYRQTGYLIDPHTSVGQAVAERYIKEESVSRPVIISATAHFAKFARAVYQALAIAKPVRDEFDRLQTITRLDPDIVLPDNIVQLKNKAIQHKTLCDASLSAVEEKIKQFLAGV